LSTSDAALAKWGLRIVFLSPLIILTLWACIVSVTGGGRHRQQSQNQQEQKLKTVRVPVRPHHKQQAELPQRRTTTTSSQSQQQQAVRVPVRPKQAVRVPVRPHKDAAEFRTTSTTTSGHVPVRPRPHPRMPLEAERIPVFVPLGQSDLPQSDGLYQSPIYMIPQEDGTMLMARMPGDYMMESAPEPPPLESTAMMATQSGATPMASSMMAISSAHSQPLSSTSSNTTTTTTEELPILPEPPEPPMQQEEPPMATKVYYYDPTSTDEAGVPDTVFDTDGNPLLLSSLQSDSAEIYLEPPAAQMSIPTYSDFVQDPPAQDQYIMISTVAVMALLVGALSARRMRSRNFLSNCIENESLHDEAMMYDTATTSQAYNTFGPWKGDLEKFDV